MKHHFLTEIDVQSDIITQRRLNLSCYVIFYAEIPREYTYFKYIKCFVYKRFDQVLNIFIEIYFLWIELFADKYSFLASNIVKGKNNVHNKNYVFKV